jgi:hypothetical protein
MNTCRPAPAPPARLSVVTHEPVDVEKPVGAPPVVGVAPPQLKAAGYVHVVVSTRGVSAQISTTIAPMFVVPVGLNDTKYDTPVADGVELLIRTSREVA